MHQRAAHYNSECLKCIHLIKTENIEPQCRLFFDDKDRAYESIVTCELNHCTNDTVDSEEINEI